MLQSDIKADDVIAVSHDHGMSCEQTLSTSALNAGRVLEDGKKDHVSLRNLCSSSPYECRPKEGNLSQRKAATLVPQTLQATTCTDSAGQMIRLPGRLSNMKIETYVRVPALLCRAGDATAIITVIDSSCWETPDSRSPDQTGKRQNRHSECSSIHLSKAGMSCCCRHC